MSHCSAERLSASVAGELGRSPVGASAEASQFSSSFEANPAVDETPSTLLSFMSAARKPALSDFAMITPICA
jgi:hypothetical protein